MAVRNLRLDKFLVRQQPEMGSVFILHGLSVKIMNQFRISSLRYYCRTRPSGVPRKVREIRRFCRVKESCHPSPEGVTRHPLEIMAAGSSEWPVYACTFRRDKQNLGRCKSCRLALP